jgi:hypothetical protein
MDIFMDTTGMDTDLDTDMETNLEIDIVKDMDTDIDTALTLISEVCESSYCHGIVITKCRVLRPA